MKSVHDSAEHMASFEALEGHGRVRDLVRLLQKDDAVGELLRSCNEVGEAFLFGGMLRDLIFGSSGVFGDLDIFVSGPLNIEFAERLARVSRRTNFGGIRLVVGRFDIDIWELPKSYAFRMQKGRVVSIESLLSTVCFSTDAVAASLMDARLLTSPAFRLTVKSGRFRFVSKPQSLELLQVVRVARIMVKNNVRPEKDVAAYFLNGLRCFGEQGLVRAEAKWRGRRVLDGYLIERTGEVCEMVLNEETIPGDFVGQRGLFQ